MYANINNIYGCFNPEELQKLVYNKRFYQYIAHALFKYCDTSKTIILRVYSTFNQNYPKPIITTTIPR